MRKILRYLEKAQWPEQHAWRQVLWQMMGNVGLTGLHAWPLHKSWVEFAAYPMPLRHLPQALEEQRIVHISDLHYSPLVWNRYLDQYVEWINELSPAVVAVTGDLYMGGRRYAIRVAELLSRLKSTHGVVSIMGNHDYGVDGKDGSPRGLRRAAYLEAAIKDHGILMLRNQHWSIHPKHAKGQLTFVGLDDDWAGQFKPQAAFDSVSETDAIICLLHNPATSLRLMRYPWQWMLSGHTHGRQLAVSRIGQRLYPKKYRQFTHGLYAINGRYLYVNRGLSYGQRARDWCRPEVTVFQLRHATSAASSSLPDGSEG